MEESDCKLMYKENVNGLKLSLKIEDRNGSPYCRIITIRYLGRQCLSNIPRLTIVFVAISYNIALLMYARIYALELAIFLTLIGFLGLYFIINTVTDEKLIVIPSVGVVISVKYIYGKQDSFMTWEIIQDVVINEVIKMNRVLYYLTFMIQDKHRDTNTMALVPVFQCTMPRLVMLMEVYKELHILMPFISRPDSAPSGAGDARNREG